MAEYETKDSGVRAQFDSGMQRDTEDGKARFDLMFPLGIPYGEQMITRLAELYSRGAVKYEDRNWEMANSEAEMARMKSSAFRHFIQWLTGETDEDHAAGAMFNIIAFETTKYKVDRLPKPERQYTDAELAEVAEEAIQSMAPYRLEPSGPGDVGSRGVRVTEQSDTGTSNFVLGTGVDPVGDDR